MATLYKFIFLCLIFTAPAEESREAFLEKVRKSNSVVFFSDSSCGSCAKLIKELPKYCDSKPNSFSVLAVGKIKKNKKKLKNFEERHTIFYKKDRKLLSDLDVPATPAFLINQKDFVVGYKAITKYISKNFDHFCTNSKT